MKSTSGLSICPRNCRAYADSDSTYRRCPSAKIVSKAREDLPDPDRPVKTTRESLGSSSEMSLRLCSRAPRTISRSLTESFSGQGVGRRRLSWGSPPMLGRRSDRLAPDDEGRVPPDPPNPRHEAQRSEGTGHAHPEERTRGRGEDRGLGCESCPIRTPAT